MTRDNHNLRCMMCGRSSTVEPQPSKLMTWVRFPSPAPVWSSGVPLRWMNNIRAHIAQSVEHLLGKEEVTGSNPVVGSIASVHTI